MKKSGQGAWNSMIWKLWHHGGCVLILSATVVCGAALGFSQTLTKGPYLVTPGATEINIRWESDAQIQCAVSYGLDSMHTEKKAAILRAAKGGGFLYEVALHGLKPGCLNKLLDNNDLDFYNRPHKNTGRDDGVLHFLTLSTLLFNLLTNDDDLSAVIDRRLTPA